MKIKYQYSEVVEEALSLFRSAIRNHQEMIERELEKELSRDDDMFCKYLREDCSNDVIIKQLRAKQEHVIQNALPIKILFEE